ncbi:MAG: xanthine dehydrogenase family protein molybdopterin-binding subunit [Deltaproteobacteria bacterium]|nr:xanthine dehydrogenase family protein molybdopterin-binding subunit [Deltaproteobacteria bacterium]MBI2366073.1 xanthine dehydrogenase family protein molybdopterin-binding subunit [Deltaproteobacteria bacterium]
MASAKQVVGNPTPRVEGELKVSGAAKYAVDVTLPGMLWGKLLRSPIASGKIKRIDASKALALRGVHAVVSGEDCTGLKIGRRLYDMPILADGEVRFIGEKVAVVAADTELIAEEAVGLIEVDYEETEPILDPVETMKPGARLIHPDVVNYKGLPRPLKEPSNDFIYITWGRGDIETGFRQADVIVENTFTTSSVHQSYIEPHSCVVKAAADGSAEFWSCSKVPYGVREQVANALKIPQEKFVFNPVYIGGDFGGKGDFMDLAVVYLLSKKARRPVKLVMGYDEEFAAGNPRHASIIHVKTGVKKDGTIVAHHMNFIFDSGAYGAFKPNAFLNGPHLSAGPYNIPHAFIEEHMVYTNKIPCGHMRSPGDPQGFFANESQMDLVAKRLGMDPIKFRQKNFMHDGDIDPTGEEIHYIKTDETLKRAMEDSGYRRPKPKNVGRGLGVVQWTAAGGIGTVAITLDEKGVATIASAMLDQGGGTYTILSEIVAEELKLPLSQVKCRLLNTSQGKKDTGVGGSRATRVYGNAGYEAALKAVEAIKRAAGEQMGVAPNEIVLAKGAALHPRMERRLTYGEIVKAKGSPITVEGTFNDSSRVHAASMCVQVAEVEVDPDTGQVELKKFTSTHNTGTVLNPLMHQGQIEGGSMTGIGYALMEQLIIADGKVATTNFGEYKIPTIKDVPRFKSSVSEQPKGAGPYNSMPIGETANIPTAAAIANAVEDACGVRIKSLPITAEKVYEALHGGK